MTEFEAKMAAHQICIGMPIRTEQEALAVLDVIWEFACDWQKMQTKEKYTHALKSAKSVLQSVRHVSQKHSETEILIDEILNLKEKD